MLFLHDDIGVWVKNLPKVVTLTLLFLAVDLMILELLIQRCNHLTTEPLSAYNNDDRLTAFDPGQPG